MALHLRARRTTRLARAASHPPDEQGGPLLPYDERSLAEIERSERERERSSEAGRSRGSSALLALGRLIFGGYFIYNGINHFRNREMLAGYAKSKGVPAADLAVAASGLMILIGGLSLLSGTRPKIGASLVMTFLLAVSPKIHDFWAVEDEQRRSAEFVNFSKNMALLGAALIAASIPEPWPGSVSRGASA